MTFRPDCYFVCAQIGGLSLALTEATTALLLGQGPFSLFPLSAPSIETAMIQKTMKFKMTAEARSWPEMLSQCARGYISTC
jgi:hypothetical protein